MNSIYLPPAGTALPDHTQLPETDGSIVENFQEFPQGMLLMDSLAPVLARLHPDRHYAIGLDSGIYWRYVAEEPLRGCKSPDWFYVPGASPMPPGTYRRSYVLWKEWIPPQIILEYFSGDGVDEHDATPGTGKFWVYEQAIRAAYYGIFDSDRSSLEMYHLTEGRYQQMTPNAHGRYFLPPLGLEIGIWHGLYSNMTLPWLRWWDEQGNPLLAGHETAELIRGQAEQERQAKEQAQREAEAAVRRADELAAKLRALGIDPEA